MPLQKNLKFIQRKYKISKMSFTTELNKLEREALLTLRNPKYDEIINKYNHLGGIQMHDTDTKNRILYMSEVRVRLVNRLLKNQKWVVL